MKFPRHVGVDLIKATRFVRFTKDRSHPFLQKNFTQQELSYCFAFAKPSEHLAGMFAAKEAVRKALGEKYPIPMIEIRHAKNGAPEAWHSKKRLPIAISISHDADLAIALAVAIK